MSVREHSRGEVSAEKGWFNWSRCFAPPKIFEDFNPFSPKIEEKTGDIIRETVSNANLENKSVYS
jgi:hypothetical protein